MTIFTNVNGSLIGKTVCRKSFKKKYIIDEYHLDSKKCFVIGYYHFGLKKKRKIPGRTYLVLFPRNLAPKLKRLLHAT